MDMFPVGLNFTGKPALVVGGGPVALRKIRALLRCGAKVVLVAPEVRPELRRMASAGRIVWRKCVYRFSFLLRRPAMVFACTDSAEVNERVAREGESAGIWVNRADCPDESLVHIPSIARLGFLTLAIFSGGRAPAYVKHLRKRLERELGRTVASELRILAEFRQRLRNRVEGAARRKRILTRLVEDGTLTNMARCSAAERRRRLNQLVADRTS